MSENFFINLIKLDLESAKKVVDQKLHIFGLPTLHQLYESHSGHFEDHLDERSMADIISQLLKIPDRFTGCTSPFIMPITHGWSSVVKTLLNNNIAIPTLNDNGKEITCLEIALNTNQLAIAKLLWPHANNISYTTAAQYFGKVFRKQIYCGLATLLLLSTGGIIYYVNL